MSDRINIANLDIDVDALTGTLTEVKKAIEQLRDRQKELRDAGEKTSAEYVRNEAVLRRQSTQYNQLNKVLQSRLGLDNQVLSAEEALNQALQSENVTIQNAVENNRELRSIRNNLNATTEEGAAAIARINERLNQNTAFIRENGDANEQRIAGIGEYRQAIDDAFASLNPLNGGLSAFLARSREAGGAGNLLRNGLTSAATGMRGLVAESLAFIATPVGATIAALVGLFAAGKAIFDFNAGLADMNKQLKGLGVSKDELSAVRSEIQATASTYEQEFNSIANSANSVSKAFKITMSEANDVVAQGLDGLSDEQQKKLLDLTNEFSIYFAQAGYDTTEYINILRAGVEQGGEIVNKLPDAIKESQIALNEQTQATKDALVNAFGTSFSTDLLARIKSGQTTVQDALVEISKKAKTANLDQQQYAQLTADVFKGAGEDAGGAAKVFEIMESASVNAYKNATSGAEQARAAQERLNKLLASQFEAQNFAETWTKLKAEGVNALSSIIEYLVELKGYIQPVIDLIGINLSNTFSALKLVVKTAFDLISANFKIIGNTIGTAVKVIKKLLTLDFAGAFNELKQGILNFGKIIDSTFAGIKNTILQFLKDVVSNTAPLLKAIGIDVDKVKAKLESWKSKEVTVKANVQSNSDEEAKKVANNTAQIKADLEKRVEYYQKVRDRLDALGKDTYQADLNLFNAQLKLYKDQPAEYDKVYNQILKLKTDHNSKVLSDSVAKLKSEYDYFVATQGSKAKALDEELKYNEQIRDKLLAIAQKEYSISKDKSAALRKLKTDEAKINADFIDKQTALVIKNADDEYNAIVERNKKALDSSKYFSGQQYNAEIERLNRLQEAEKDRSTVRLENQKKSQQEINDALLAIDADYNEKKKALQQQQTDYELNKQLIDIENKRASMITEFGADQELRLQQLEILRQQEITSAEKTGADIADINAKYEKEKLDVIVDSQNRKAQMYSDTFGNISTILGKESAAGKVFAAAQATVDAYVAANKALAAYPPPFGFIAAAAAVGTGLNNVQKIINTKPKFERGGLMEIGGKRHSQGGTKFYGEDGTQFEAERGELIGVLNRSAADHFMRFNNSFLNGANTSPTNYLATGGIVQRNINSNQGFDYDLLAVKIAQANASLPTPVVKVTDLATVTNDVIRVQNAATH